MSSSPKAAPVVRGSEHREIQPFPYDPVPSGHRGGSAIAGVTGDDTGENAAATREIQTRADGRQEGQAAAQKIFEERMAHERSALAAALSQFSRDRATYFQNVEGEVVKLALSIARKIVHRESQLDPLLLAGIVRVALDSIDGATGVRLRIHPQNTADWRRYLATHLEPSDLPEIIEDPSQPPDGCALETSMGTAVMGLEVQLKEIEQGLMDLLAARPGVSS